MLASRDQSVSARPVTPRREWHRQQSRSTRFIGRCRCDRQRQRVLRAKKVAVRLRTSEALMSFAHSLSRFTSYTRASAPLSSAAFAVASIRHSRCLPVRDRWTCFEDPLRYHFYRLLLLLVSMEDPLSGSKHLSASSSKSM